jgi:mannose-6-phosphate isomerase
MSGPLPTREVEKPWGKDKLPAPFEAPEGKRIGEVWFEPPSALRQLLVKYIFTSEALSVQVHPSDAQTLEKGLGRQGKEECWLILDAEPGAQLGIGFERELAGDEMRAASLDGSIERLMTWHPVAAGDFFYIPANTVHAIGAGVSLIEVQQNSDITYRLYDYGRPRELHLEDGVLVARGEPYARHWRKHVPADAAMTLVDGPLFRLDQVAGEPEAAAAARFPAALLAIPRTGAITVGGETVLPGGCALADRLADIVFAPGGVCLLAAPCGG